MIESRLHILHVIPAIASRYGGPSVAVVDMCRALRDAGVDALIATTDADGPGRLNVPLGQEVDISGTRAIFFRRRLSESFKWAPALEAWLREHVSRFDLVHIHAVFSHTSVAAGRVCLDQGVPYIVRPLGTLDPWSLAHHARRKRVLLKIGALRVLRGASAMHYTSADEQRLAEEAVDGLPHGIVTPLGVDESLLRASDEPPPVSDQYLLALARLDPKKGFDLLIDAFHGLADDPLLRGWRLIVAGDGDPDYVADLRSRAASGPAGERITFVGWVDGQTKRAWLRHAALFALPSHQENFGLSVAEAMACGVPVIVSPGVNLAADIDAHGAGWVVAREQQALTGTLRAAMGDELGRRRRGDAARRLARAFRWPSIAGQLRDAYEATLTAALERGTLNAERRTSSERRTQNVERSTTAKARS
jgi:glycosyltransferase involved in cell wall biosynthesis